MRKGHNDIETGVSIVIMQTGLAEILKQLCKVLLDCLGAIQGLSAGGTGRCLILEVEL
jgi:hypothetical protein